MSLGITVSVLIYFIDDLTALLQLYGLYGIELDWKMIMNVEKYWGKGSCGL